MRTASMLGLAGDLTVSILLMLFIWRSHGRLRRRAELPGARATSPALVKGMLTLVGVLGVHILLTVAPPLAYIAAGIRPGSLEPVPLYALASSTVNLLGMAGVRYVIIGVCDALLKLPPEATGTEALP